MIGHLVSLKQLEALIWVADLGSFRKAAHHLNTTQPNISSRIASLEKTFGINLMQRDAGSVQMTQKGSEFLEQARLILRNSETLLDIAARPDLLENRLRLGATELVAATWLRPFMVRLKEAYPNMSVELTVDFSRHLDTELAANRLDLTIQSAPFAKPATGMIALGSYDYVWVANGAIAAQLQASDAVQDAAFVYPILTQARHTQAYLDLVDHFEKATAPDVRFVPSNSLSAAIHMAMDGLGVAVLPRAMISSQLLEGSLVAVPIDWTPQPLRFAARYHAGKASAFVQRAAEIAAECADAFDAG